jgi:hypothetical protein
MSSHVPVEVGEESLLGGVNLGLARAGAVVRPLSPIPNGIIDNGPFGSSRTRITSPQAVGQKDETFSTLTNIP